MRYLRYQASVPPRIFAISTPRINMNSQIISCCIGSKVARLATGSLLAVLPALTGIRVDAAELVCGSGYYAYQGACVIVPTAGVVVAPAPVVVPAPVYGARPYYGAPGYGAPGVPAAGAPGYGAPGVPAAGRAGYGAPGVPAAGAPGYGAAGRGANFNGGVNRPARR